jgi:ATP-dependent Lon protease
MIEITPEAMDFLIESYTREAGVRSLKREIASVCRWVAKELASEKRSGKVVVDVPLVEEIRGPVHFFKEVAERTSVPGVATGLAWTATGGDILFIEATKMRGKGNLTLTGSLGDVMKESVSVARSYVKATATELGIEDEVFDKFDVHVHVPSGAIPKDGPSAGVTMITAMTSLLTGLCVDPSVAMTGEITLRGQVLPVGGIKEKVLAAHRAGIKKVLLPDKNKKDIIEVPEEIRSQLTFVFCARMEEVLNETLGADNLAKLRADLAEKVKNRPATPSVPAPATPEA